MLRPRRSSFHTTSVSPFPRVLSTRFSPGRSEVFPLILSSNISSHPAHSSAVRCNAVFWSFVDTLTYPISMVLSPAKCRKHATGEQNGHSQNVGLGTASKRNVGTGENQIPDMGAFASGSGWFRLPGGYIVQFGTFSGNTTRFISGHFPIPFPNQPMVSVSVMSDAVQSDPSNPAPQVLSVNFEHISNSAWRVATSDISQQYRFSYISIGR